jgi:maltose alpha-D-glucosyltransferase/alpha-amylase
MQWTPDRNAGFSSSDPGKLYLPAVQSLVYHYSAVNVETELAQPRSLLHFVRQIVHLRKAHMVFAVGDLTVCSTDNGAVLAYLRSTTEEDCQPGERPETVLCVFSFAHYPTSVNVTLPEGVSAERVIDLFGGSRFPAAVDGKITLTLGTQGFYWLQLS